MYKNTFLLFSLYFAFLFSNAYAQNCIGGQIYTKEAFQYGRFEVSMRSAGGDGIISSFFLYHLDLGCNWPDENNEIDIEMTGNNELLHFTTHYPGPWYETDILDLGLNPHENLNEYAFEWEPGIVRWFVNGVLVNVQDQDFVSQLVYPMRIMMNLWASGIENWVGVWNPALMPVASEYDYVKYLAYTPGTGTAGTNNNFTPSWEDHFESFNEERWIIEQDGGFSNNFCRFQPTSVVIEDSRLFLQLEEAITDSELVPVTFSVNTLEQNLEPSDVIYLNGSFNNWCGNCFPLLETNGVWSGTIDLEPGTSYEFLFTKNFWEENGGAPLNSECDYQPCDEWANYGLFVPHESEPIVLDTPCWNTCSNCSLTSTIEIPNDKVKKVIKVYDMLGREVKAIIPGRPLIYLYEDGSIDRKVYYE
jgi:endo-1,3-1,4-beta-glycanase ExoK